MRDIQPRARDDITEVAATIQRGELAIQHCASCGAWTWFPRVACPSCFKNALEWREVSGSGEISAVATVHKTHHVDYEPYVPIVLVLVDLDEGPQMVASLVGENRLDAEIGHRVHVAANERWSTLPQFERQG